MAGPLLFKPHSVWDDCVPFNKVDYVGLNGTTSDGPLPDPQHNVKASESPINLIIPQPK